MDPVVVWSLDKQPAYGHQHPICAAICIISHDPIEITINMNKYTITNGCINNKLVVIKSMGYGKTMGLRPLNPSSDKISICYYSSQRVLNFNHFIPGNNSKTFAFSLVERTQTIGFRKNIS